MARRNHKKTVKRTEPSLRSLRLKVNAMEKVIYELQETLEVTLKRLARLEGDEDPPPVLGVVRP